MSAPKPPLWFHESENETGLRVGQLAAVGLQRKIRTAVRPQTSLAADCSWPFIDRSVTGLTEIAGLDNDGRSWIYNA